MDPQGERSVGGSDVAAAPARSWRRRLWRSWWAPPLVLALVLGLLAALGQFGSGTPYRGREAEVREPLELDRWEVVVDRAWLERDQTSWTEEQLRVRLGLTNTSPRSSFGPRAALLLAVFGDEVLSLGQCEPENGTGYFQPGIPVWATCKVSLTDEGLLLPMGDLPFTLVLMEEGKSQRPTLDERWDIGSPRYHVDLVAKDGRTRD